MKDLKIGVISDTHYDTRTKLLPLDALYEHFSGADLIIHAGDLVRLNVLDEINNIADVEAVCGNMDHREVSQALAKKKVITLNGVNIGIMHGFGSPYDLPAVLLPYFKNIKLNILVFGHTHRPYNEYIDNVLCFNPGSPIMPYLSGQPTIGMINISSAGKISSRIIDI